MGEVEKKTIIKLAFQYKVVCVCVQMDKKPHIATMPLDSSSSSSFFNNERCK